jgi:hypothetical protein
LRFRASKFPSNHLFKVSEKLLVTLKLSDLWQWVLAAVQCKVPLQSLESSALVRRLHFTDMFGQVDVLKIEQLNVRLPEDGANVC